MYLNDFFDRAIDARERPDRPIAAGAIGASVVAWIGFGLLALGIVLMAPFGRPAAACGCLLAAAILVYDVWHKGNPLSPLVMGGCRALVYVGACVAISGEVTLPAVLGALALACHVAGLTYAARQEHHNRIGGLWPLLMLAMPFLVAVGVGAGEWTAVLALVLLFVADAVAVDGLARRQLPGAVGLAVSRLIAAICIVDAVAIAWVGASAVLVALAVAGYGLTRIAQKVIPGT
jgi:UbiA prenyltransferase family